MSATLTAPADPSTSQVGPYELLGVLSEGGMSRVYRARDPRLGRDVAIKVVHDRFSDRVSREARAIAALSHPHICTIYDVGPNYLVMELIDGQTLAARIAEGPMPQDELLPIARQIAGALEAAHRAGVMHRDLKPANIMVGRTGQCVDGPIVKVLDFGLALLVAAEADITRTAPGIVAGTPAYMSPEQVEAKRLDMRSDVFSFGSILYELVSGRRAFTGSSIHEVMNAVVRTEPPPLDTSLALDRVIRRCLQKETARRFQTMADVRAALDAIHEQPDAVPSDARPSIAVLPFVDMSQGEDSGWFGDGMTEEIINALVPIHGLSVVARTSAFAYKGRQEDIRRIADALGASHVLEGSVRRVGDRVRVTAQLIAADSGIHLSSERYDADVTDVLSIQDEIAREIAASLEIKLVTLGSA